MKVTYSIDSGKILIDFAAKSGNTNIDFPFFIADLYNAANSKTILKIRDTSGANVVNNIIDKEYIVKDFDLISTSKTNLCINMELVKTSSMELIILELKNIVGIEQVHSCKYYITSDYLKDDVLGFMFLR